MKLLLPMLAFLSFSSATFANVQYTIKSGDTLQRIAKQELGNSSRWKEILAMNPSVIKGNGNLIFPGKMIRLPSDGTPTPAPAKPDTSPTITVSTSTTNAKQVAKNDKSIKVLMSTGEYAPFTGAKLDNKGLFTEIVTKSFAKMGYQFEIDFMSWSNAMKLAHERGIYHVTFPWYENEERRQNYYYSDPVQPTIVSAFSLKNSGFMYTKKSDLRHKRLCRPAGYFTHDISDMVKSGVLTHIAPPTTKDCFELLIKGRVDLVSEDDQVGRGIMKDLGITSNVTVSDQPMMIRPLHVIFPKRLNQLAVTLRDDFNKGLNQLDQSGELAEIVIKHLRNQ